MIALGIDPGLDGALAWQRVEGAARLDYGVVDTPTQVLKTKRGEKRIYDVPRMRDTLIDLVLDHEGDVRATLEWVHAGAWNPMSVRRAQGASTAYSMGYGVAIWEGLLTALYVPYARVTAPDWKRVLLPPGCHDKKSTCVEAQQRWPAIELSLVKHHGRADAMFICEYGVSRGGTHE